MANQRRASEGVVTVLFPRTDFPQQGWIRKPTVNGTAQDFYEAYTDFGWYGQTQSFRVYDKTSRYGKRPRSQNRPFYQTVPNPVFNHNLVDRAREVPGILQLAPRYERVRDKTKTYGKRPRSQNRPFYQTVPNPVFNHNLVDRAREVPGILQLAPRYERVRDKTKTYGKRPRSQNRPFYQTVPNPVFNHNLVDRAREVPGILQLAPRYERVRDKTKTYGKRPRSQNRPFYQTVPNPVFNHNLVDRAREVPGILQLAPRYERVRDKTKTYGKRPRSPIRPLYQTKPQQGWLAKPVLTGGLALYEARTGFGWYSFTQSFRVADRLTRYNKRPNSFKYQQYQTVVDPASRIFFNLPPDVFDFTLIDWGIYYPQTPRPRLRSWRPTEPAQSTHVNPNFYDTDIRFPAIAQALPNDTKATVKPRYLSWRPTEPAQSTHLDPNQYDTDIRWAAIDYSKTPTRPVPKITRWRPTEPTPFSWLYQDTIFDPSIFPAIPAKPGRELPKIKFRTSDPVQFDWLYQDPLLDPLIFPSTVIPDIRTGKRLHQGWLPTEPAQLSWLFQGVIIDPRVFTWDVPSYRDKRSALNTKRPGGDVHGDQTTAWFYANVFEFDPALYAAVAMFSWDRMPDRVPGTSVLQPVYMDMAWLFDVIPLTDGITVDDYLFYYHYRRHRSLDAIAKKKVIAKKRRRRR